MKIQNHYSSLGHPQANGQTEVTNRSLLKIIKTRLDGVNDAWLEELPNVLWAYHTTIRMPTEETPFQIDVWLWSCHSRRDWIGKFTGTGYNEYQNEEELKTNLDLIDKSKNEAQQRMAKYQGAITRYYNRRVRIRRFNQETSYIVKYPKQLKIPHKES